MLSFTSVLLFYLQQPAFSSQEIETMHTWNSEKINDWELTYVVDSKDKVFHGIVDRAIGKWEKELQVITFAESKSVDRADIYFQQVTSDTMIGIAGYADDGREIAGHTEVFRNAYDSTIQVDIHVLEGLDIPEKYKAVLHQFGHALGLGYSDDEDDLMYKDPKIENAREISDCDKYMVFWIHGLDMAVKGIVFSGQELDKLYGECIKGAADLYEDEKYDYENNDDNEFTWFDYDNDGALTEYDVDMMCDNTTAYEGDCKKAYNWIEKTYGYETEED